MFQNWGFLLSEVWGLILLAALLGLFCGWLIWDRGKELAALRKRHLDRKRELELKTAQYATQDDENNALLAQLQALDDTQASLEARDAELEAESATLRRDLKLAQAQAQDVEVKYTAALSQNELLNARGEANAARIAQLENELAAARARDNNAAQAKPAPHVIATRLPHRAPPQTGGAARAIPDYDGDGVYEGQNEGQRPATLAGPRGGTPDDLKKIKGVGPKLEAMLHDLGFFHFDQIATWSGDEVAWVDANLGGFNGRVSRDRWIDQARTLAAGGTTEFAARVEEGALYD